MMTEKYDAAKEAELNAIAADDLRRIEQEVVAEAEASVDDFDAMKDEQKAADAAEAAYTFEAAQGISMDIEAESEARLEK
ncbi:hypothetical protein [Adlercreutzia agrestimuris]|uniref:hypothetical protein n=1 Tax=Adlercreutzia agrestimuris TaxID=2941324 RepID=UPI00203BB874|nr:hypothetical protein [Adlercreutzia agrestimuris]